jgi:hypothetical protein
MSDVVPHVSATVCEMRPDWDEWVVGAVLRDLSQRVPVEDWAPAALLAAANLDLPSPKAIIWRGSHWDHAKVKPAEVTERERCDVCGKTESRCLTQRPGKDDDHPFTPATPVTVERPS